MKRENVQAVVLAGGKGSRMYPLTQSESVAAAGFSSSSSSSASDKSAHEEKGEEGSSQDTNSQPSSPQVHLAPMSPSSAPSSFQSAGSSANAQASATPHNTGNTETVVKPLLPVANRPLISFALEMLARSGFRHAFVVTTKGCEESLQRWLESDFQEHSRGLKCTVVTCDADHADGSADALLAVRKHITAQDLLVVSADTIVVPDEPSASSSSASTDAVQASSASASASTAAGGAHSTAPASSEPIATAGSSEITGIHSQQRWLHRMLDLHRANDSTVTLLLKRQPHSAVTNTQQKAVQGTAAADLGAVDYIGLTSNQRIIVFRAAADVEDSGLRLGKDVLSSAGGSVSMHRNLLDAHVYLLSRWALELVHLNAGTASPILSIKGELLPLLVKMQTKSHVRRFRIPSFPPLAVRALSRSVDTPLLGGKTANVNKVIEERRAEIAQATRKSADRLAELSSAPLSEEFLRRRGTKVSKKSALAISAAIAAGDSSAAAGGGPEVVVRRQSSAVSVGSRESLGTRVDRLSIRCFAFILDEDQFCTRVNTIKTFMSANRDVASFSPTAQGAARAEAPPLTGYLPWEKPQKAAFVHPTAKLLGKTQIGPECVIGASSELGDKVSVKKSNIGKHCRIGAGVKIENSVIMDHVTIADRCAIKNCVISDQCMLEQMTSLTSCYVGHGYKFDSKTKEANMSFCREDSFM